MDKAILVIDMPRCCNECSLMFQDEYSYWCPVKCDKNKTDLYENYIMFHTKPDWCPLKPMPNKQHFNGAVDYENDYLYGWNACINKILSN